MNKEKAKKKEEEEEEMVCLRSLAKTEYNKWMICFWTFLCLSFQQTMSFT